MPSSHAPQWSRAGVGDGFGIVGDDGGAEEVPGEPVHATLNRRIRDLVMLFSPLSIDRYAKSACRLPVLNGGSLRKCGIKERSPVTAALPPEFQR